MDDLINRQDAINSLEEERCPCESEYDQGYLSMLDKAIWIIKEWLPSIQPEDWLEKNKERILQAGMEGREVEFRIGGRLFRIREVAQ